MSSFDPKEYEEDRKKYQEAWSFLIPRFLPEYKWYQQLSAGTGWCELVKKLTAYLDAIWEGWEAWRGQKSSECWGLMQCKEKFGVLRFYAQVIAAGDKDSEDYKKRAEDFHETISDYGRKSSIVCETCGSEGQLRSVGGWIATVCQK